MKILWIIPARSWSKWVINKNIKDFCWKPLLAWTIEECKKTNLIDKLIISTDSSKFAEVAKKYWCKVPFLRPTEISTDKSLDIEFILHTLEYLKINENYVPDIILRLPPTSPLRTYKHIEEWIKMLLNDKELDSVRPITLSPKHPYKMWKIENTYLVPFLDEDFTWINESWNAPRQIFPDVYIQTWAIDIIRLNTILEYKSTSWKKIWYFFMKPEESINIDSQIDFDFAEFLMQKKIKDNIK